MTDYQWRIEWPALRRPRIYRRRPGMWVVIDTNHATYSASTWRQAMDFVCPRAPRTVAELTDGISRSTEALIAAIRRAEEEQR